MFTNAIRRTLAHCALLLLLAVAVAVPAWAQKTAARAAPVPAASAQKAPERAGAADAEQHILGPGDVVRISVFQNPDLGLETRISEQGEISFPLIGSVELGGLSVRGAEQRIARALRDGKYVINPQVNVLVMQIRSAQVSILGQVNKPGRYPIDQVGSKVSEMIAAAGGPMPGASDLVTLTGTRNGRPVKMEIDLPAVLQAGKSELDPTVQNGDILHVDRAPQIYVYGEVQRPGVSRLERGMTVMQALAQSGGLTPRGTERGLRIHRRDASGAVTVVRPKLNDLVERDDVIYVRESLF